MSYRKVTVEGKVYEYVVGKVFVKIKDFGLFKVADVGNPILNRVLGKDRLYQTTPATIASIIKKEPLPRMFSCRHGTKTHELVYDPFHVEIKNKFHTMLNCKECYANSRDNI